MSPCLIHRDFWSSTPQHEMLPWEKGHGFCMRRSSKQSLLAHTWTTHGTHTNIRQDPQDPVKGPPSYTYPSCLVTNEGHFLWKCVHSKLPIEVELLIFGVFSLFHNLDLGSEQPCDQHYQYFVKVNQEDWTLLGYLIQRQSLCTLNKNKSPDMWCQQNCLRCSDKYCFSFKQRKAVHTAPRLAACRLTSKYSIL